MDYAASAKIIQHLNAERCAIWFARVCPVTAPAGRLGGGTKWFRVSDTVGLNPRVYVNIEFFILM